jgi:hypothetical protein
MIQLRYRPPHEIDLARFELWTRQLLVDAAANDPGAVSGDVVTLEYMRDRFAHTLDGSEIRHIDTELGDLRATADDENLDAATDSAEQLLKILEQVQK